MSKKEIILRIIGEICRVYSVDVEYEEVIEEQIARQKVKYISTTKKSSNFTALKNREN